MNSAAQAKADARARMAVLRARWAGLAPRERQLVSLAAAAVGLLVLWLLLLQPALKTLSQAPARIDSATADLAAMRKLADEAKTLKGAAPVPLPEATAALKAATTRLGSHATLQVIGERATLTLQGVDAAALQAWLAEARAGARARPIEAQLQQVAGGWQGQLVLSLGGS